MTPATSQAHAIVKKENAPMKRESKRLRFASVTITLAFAATAVAGMDVA